MNTVRRVAALLVALVLALALAACGGYDDTVVPRADEPAAPEPAAPATCTNNGVDELRSYEPTGDVGEGPAVDRIRARGRLVAGVAADTKLLGSRNARTGTIEGFDIDLVNAIAAEIFGTAVDHVTLKVITAADRIPELQSGGVDIVARNMTINCARWEQIAFSAEYYHAGQKVLVGTDSDITSIDDLAGKRICAPVGTTSIENIQKLQPEAIPVTAGDNSECMVLFQAGEADGVSTDDTVLAGLAAQDPYSTVLKTEQLTNEPYGIGVNADDVDLVRLINQVLEDMRDDGRWQRSYNTWLAPYLGAGSQPRALYGR